MKTGFVTTALLATASAFEVAPSTPAGRSQSAVAVGRQPLVGSGQPWRPDVGRQPVVLLASSDADATNPPPPSLSPRTQRPWRVRAAGRLLLAAAALRWAVLPPADVSAAGDPATAGPAPTPPAPTHTFAEVAPTFEWFDTPSSPLERALLQRRAEREAAAAAAAANQAVPDGVLVPAAAKSLTRANSPKGTSFVAAAATRVRPCVVHIEVELQRQALPFGVPPGAVVVPLDPFDSLGPGGPGGPMPPPPPLHSQGSGFIFDSKGLVLSNAHVVRAPPGAAVSSLTVTMADGERYDAKVLGMDDLYDLAVLQITPKTETTFPAVELGDSGALDVGDWVIAVGSPFGLEDSVTLGIVSSTTRSLPSSSLPVRGTMIQTDAAFNPGNSGGPLVNEFGQVVGINTLIWRDSNNIGFAIPINRAKNAVDLLVAGERLSHAWIGISTGSLTPVEARRVNNDPNEYPPFVPEVYGALIKRIEPEGPAAEAGLRIFDVVREANGRVVRSSVDLAAAVDDCGVGEQLLLKVTRGDRDIFVDVKTSELPEPPALVPPPVPFPLPLPDGPPPGVKAG